MTMNHKNFAAFILTHGRPNKVKTYNTLKKCGYTGKIYIVIDNEDDTANEYIEKYKGEVVMFDKLAISKTFDTGDNFTDRRSIVYARNACFQIAKELGVKYFIQLDDDYDRFAYKFNRDLVYDDKNILNLDKIFDLMLNFLLSTPTLTIAMAQNGDFIGGKNSGFATKLGIKRKAMNTFICKTDNPIPFVGRINEDVNTYTNGGSRGLLFITIPNVSINQAQTQSSKGGMTELYKDNGTYLKSFYSVMYQPSSVKIGLMGDKYKRLHHAINWNCTAPKIISESVRKL